MPDHKASARGAAKAASEALPKKVPNNVATRVMSTAAPMKKQRQRCTHPPCRKFGHEESECWVKHPELRNAKKNGRPKNMGDQDGTKLDHQKPKKVTRAALNHPTVDRNNTKGTQTVSSQNNRRPLKPATKRCYFLELPGELRNQIYEYAFPSRFVALRPNSPLDSQQIFAARGQPRTALQCTRIMGKHRPVAPEFVRWTKSLSPLILTCRKVFNEAAPYLYGNTTFFFGDPKRLQAFVDTVRPQHLAFVTNVRIFCITYGSPSIFDMSRWETAHLARWTQTCHLIALNMPNISSLHVTISLAGVQYLRFSPNGSTWDTAAHLPFVALAQLSKLSTVTVRIFDREWVIPFSGVYPSTRQYCDREPCHPIWTVAAADFTRFTRALPTLAYKRRVYAKHQQHVKSLQMKLVEGLARIVKGCELDTAMAHFRTAQREWTKFQEDPMLNS